MAVFLVMSTVVPSQFEVWDTPLWETKFGKRFVIIFRVWEPNRVPT